jgi:uroporphyrin-III C-methyltransferase / precorrin-2 dehydrogenase / sirohydrochlorin ferrochelatase
MPKATIDVLCAELLRRGLSAGHPAVAVFNATRANETIVTASIGTLPERIAAVDTGAPCIILIDVDATKRVLAMRSPAREHANA